jgi:SSS family solute:Na+ symporter
VRLHWLDWLVVAVYLVWIVWDGLRRSRETDRVEGYFLGNRNIPWWAAGLSVMATQLSAITLIGTTGRGYVDGLSVVQLYLGLPIAMIVLSMTLVPFFYRARVYTAYEYLERRFDAKTRTLTSVLFLLQRSLSCGTIVSAPAVILSIVLGWDLRLTVLAIGLPTVLYTMFGGVQAVTWTDVKQMAVIVAGVAAVIAALVVKLPDGVSVGQALHVAGATGRMRALDFSPDLTRTYTFWSGMIGGLFLMLSYFGCDQSQVQRYLTARSVDESRQSLLLSAFVKIPLQVIIPLTGVLMFTFYVFQRPPLLFNPQHDAEIRASARAADYAALERAFVPEFDARRSAARAFADAQDAGDEARLRAARAGFLEADARVAGLRRRASALVQEVTGDRAFGDVNYVYPTFVTTELPRGFIGLIIAAIFAAAMSSIAGELNALSTATVIDLYRRFGRPEASDRHFLFVSKLATGFWGLVACVVALYAANLGPLIDVVNRFGSYFYGSILGVFVLAVAVRIATPLGAFVGLLAGMAAVGLTATFTSIAFLWYNVVGAAAVVVAGVAISLAERMVRR